MTYYGCRGTLKIGSSGSSRSSSSSSRYVPLSIQLKPPPTTRLRSFLPPSRLPLPCASARGPSRVWASAATTSRALPVSLQRLLSDTNGYNLLEPVWSMPGGFTSGGDREGYQTVEEPTLAPSPRPHAPPSAPPPTLPNSNINAPGAYQSV